MGVQLRLAECGLGSLEFWVAFVRRSVCVGFAGYEKGLLEKGVASRFEVCDGCPGPGEPGRTECA